MPHGRGLCGKKEKWLGGVSGSAICTCESLLLVMHCMALLRAPRTWGDEVLGGNSIGPLSAFEMQS